MRCFILSLCLLFSGAALAQPVKNIVIVTIDGLRWQEVFSGVDSFLVHQPKASYPVDALQSRFYRNRPQERAALLMPFMHQTVAGKGVLWGDRKKGSIVEVANNYWFSYPGYNELFSGNPVETVNSNDAVYNDNITVLEILQQQPAFKDKIAVFGSWDRFRYIFNDLRSGIPVNDGFRDATGQLNAFQQLLNQQQHVFPKIFGGWERLDYFTFYQALEYMKANHPRVLVIALGDTDEFAHSGKYDLYIDAAHQSDRWIEELWNHIQSDPFYKDETVLLITTDHGRGASENGDWRSHGRSVTGSNEMWLGMIGPNVQRFQQKGTIYQAQVAPTIMKLLGVDYQLLNERYKAF